jgi:hypothetical protein
VLLIEIREDIGQRDAHRRARRIKRAALRLAKLSTRADVRAPGNRIQNPHVGHAEIQVVRDARGGLVKTGLMG